MSTAGLEPTALGLSVLRSTIKLCARKEKNLFPLLKSHYDPNRIKNATKRVNNAMDSVNANPRSAYPTNCFAIKGLRLAAWIKDPNTIPIPAPTPAKAIRALPAPINFAACTTVRDKV
jgi:hypothetical protein